MQKQIDVYTVNDIAQSLGINIETVRTYIKRGELKASKIGRKYVITDEGYKAFIQLKEVEV
ncbi:helix-turn-helix domain-containing protein [Staphylococcus xylosus]|uniref:helix-turn-helix domain-containing protein n=1 Tax=Staphylococcus xylosus TaxID=1288 RepID=UPI0036B95867